MSEAIVKSVSSIPVARQQVAPLDFSQDQLKIIRDSFLNGASPSEAAVLLELARVRRLNPITRQIHFVKRRQWDSEAGHSKEVWSAQVGIDGFRAIADRTGLYDGQDEPEFEYDEKRQLKLCRVRVYRKDWTRPAVGVAHFGEYAQTIRDKKSGTTRLASMWADKPHIMLAKCAEALAFRKAFPEDTSGLYAPEEEELEREEKDITPASNIDVPQPKTKALAEKIASRIPPATVTSEAAPAQEKPAPRMSIESVPAKLPEDEYGSGKELAEITDEQLANRKAYSLRITRSKLTKEKAKEAQEKFDAILAEEDRRMSAKAAPLPSEPQPDADANPY